MQRNLNYRQIVWLDGSQFSMDAMQCATSLFSLVRSFTVSRAKHNPESNTNSSVAQFSFKSTKHTTEFIGLDLVFDTPPSRLGGWACHENTNCEAAGAKFLTKINSPSTKSLRHYKLRRCW